MVKIYCLIFNLAVCFTAVSGKTLSENNDHHHPRESLPKTFGVENVRQPTPPSVPCSDVFSCEEKEDGNYPNPLDCSKFFVCKYGQICEIRCPAGLEFNPRIADCDDPAAALCEVCPTTEPPTESPTPTAPPTTPVPTVIPTTEPVTVWSTVTPITEIPPTLTPTTDITTTESPTTTPTVDDCTEEFTCAGKVDGCYPNPNNCSNLFFCTSGQHLTIICPAGQEVNPVTVKCEAAETAGCVACQPPTTEPPILPPFCLEPFSCAGKTDGNHENPWNCETYYFCVSGEIYEGSFPLCPKGTQFDPQLRLCQGLGGLKRCNSLCPNQPPTGPPPTLPPTTEVTTPQPPTTTEPSICDAPFTCTGKPNGDYVDPFDCGVCYTCFYDNVEGQLATQYLCPTTITEKFLTFNATIETKTPRCVNQCPSPTEPTTQATTEIIPTTTLPQATTTQGPCAISCLDKADGMHTSPYDCNTYFGCVNQQITYISSCLEGQIFNPETLFCEELHEPVVCQIIECPSPTTPEPTTTGPTTPEPCPVVTCEGKEDDAYPYAPDCNKFIFCKDQVQDGDPQDCAPGLQFNAATHFCDWPELANCVACPAIPSTTPIIIPDTAAPTTEPTTTQTQTEVPVTETTTSVIVTEITTVTQPTEESTTPEPCVQTTCEDKLDGVYPDVFDCGKFIQCINHVQNGEILDCPDGLHFNSVLQVCDWPQDANCVACPLSPVTESTTPTVVTQTPAPPTEGLTTPEPTTPATPAPETTTQSPETTPPDPCAFSCVDKEDGHYPNVCDCATFWNCTNGIGVEQSCGGDGIIFDPVELHCDWAAYANCEEIPLPTPAPETTTQSPETTPPDPCSTFSCEGKADGNYQNLCDCSIYWKCNNGIAEEAACEEGWEFDTELDHCNFASYGECEVILPNP